ncbi:dihydroxy-acid dehydratase [Klebsiella pneumoniae subsp. pneumoniae]|nr:dihydroxy-acid dehydratase [Klebsiella pneumoniae subsp. pneumoniae]
MCDMIAIDIPNRSIQLQLSDAEIAARRKPRKRVCDQAWTPKNRQRQVSFAPSRLRQPGDQRRQRRGTR